MKFLRLLFSARIERLCFVIGTSEALAQAIDRSDEVQKMRAAISSGAITLEQVASIVKRIAGRFEPKKRLRREEALGIIAIVLTSVAHPIAEKIITELAAVQVKELPIGPRLARLALTKRQRELGGSTSRVFVLSVPKGGALRTSVESGSAYANPPRALIAA